MGKHKILRLTRSSLICLKRDFQKKRHLLSLAQKTDDLHRCRDAQAARWRTRRSRQSRTFKVFAFGYAEPVMARGPGEGAWLNSRILRRPFVPHQSRQSPAMTYAAKPRPRAVPPHFVQNIGVWEQTMEIKEAIEGRWSVREYEPGSNR